MIPDLRALLLDLAGPTECSVCGKPIHWEIGWVHDDQASADGPCWGIATPKPLPLEALVTAALAAGVTVEDFTTALGMVKVTYPTDSTIEFGYDGYGGPILLDGHPLWTIQ